jgi:hypothetical protein
MLPYHMVSGLAFLFLLWIGVLVSVIELTARHLLPPTALRSRQRATARRLATRFAMLSALVPLLLIAAPTTSTLVLSCAALLLPVGCACVHVRRCICALVYMYVCVCVRERMCVCEAWCGNVRVYA